LDLAVRITAGVHTARTVLWPALRRVLPDHPEIKVEVVVDYGLTERFDAGARLSGMVAKDMVAVRIAADMRMATVAAPALPRGPDAAQAPGGPHRSHLHQHAPADPRAASAPGSSRREAARSGFGWRVSWCSTRSR
jgi:DNA-binding transcriptional LysR family regulator